MLRKAYKIQIDYPTFCSAITREDNHPAMYYRFKMAEGEYCRNKSTNFGLYASEYYQNAPYYFWADGDYLKCLGLDILIKFDKLELPTNYTPEVQKKIERYYDFPQDSMNSNEIKTIFQYLKGFGFHPTPYYKALLKFKWKVGILSFPPFEQSDFLKIRDGNLWGWVSDDNEPCFKLLSERVVNREILRLHGKRIGKFTYKEKCKLDELSSTLVKEVKAAYEALPYVQQIEQVAEEETVQAVFSWGKVKYIPVLDQMSITYYKYRQGHRIRDDILSKNPSLSKEGRESLKKLTRGNIAVLDDISKLIVRVTVPESDPNYLWIITGDENAVKNFKRWIYDVAEERFGSAIFTEDKEKRNEQFLQEQGNDCRLQINPQFNSKLSKNLLKRMSHFVEGTEIDRIDDPYILNKSVVSRGALIYVAETVDLKLFKDIPHKNIQIPPDWKWPRESDVQWIQSCLLAHGYRLLSMQKEREKSQKKYQVFEVEKALEQFIDKFCVRSGGKVIGKKDTYRDFKRYCQAHYGEKTEIGTQQAFYERFMDVAQCEEGTPRTSPNLKPNVKAFIDVMLDEEKLSKDIEQVKKENELESHNILQEPVGFDDYIDSFTELMTKPKSK